MIQQLSLRGTERKERTYTRDLNPGCCLVTHQTSLRIESTHSCCMIACFLTSRHSNLTWRLNGWEAEVQEDLTSDIRVEGIFSSKNQNCLVVSTHLKDISQIGNLPRIGMKIKHIWNHQLETPIFLDHQRSSPVQAFGTCLSSSKSGGGFSSWKKVDHFPTFSVKKRVEALKPPVVSHMFLSQIGERYNQKL